MPERWARTCTVVRLTPRSVSTALPDSSLAAVPLPTAATTREPVPAAVPGCC